VWPCPGACRRGKSRHREWVASGPRVGKLGRPGQYAALFTVESEDTAPAVRRARPAYRRACAAADMVRAGTGIQLPPFVEGEPGGQIMILHADGAEYAELGGEG